MIRSKVLLSTAGGGKTTRLIERIKEVKERALILSFTRSACDEILVRSGVKAYTLHSFCMRLMRKDYILVTNVEDMVKVFNDTSLSNDLIMDLVSRYDEDTEFRAPSAPHDKYNEEFVRVFARIQEEKQKHKIYFFSDILKEFLHDIEEFLPTIYDQYDHILVDEAQDLSEVQWKIVFRMITSCFNEHGKSFFVAGDRKQVVYDFNGSSQDLYDEYVKKLMELNTHVELEQSTVTYRFGGKIARMVSEEFEKHESSIEEGAVVVQSLHPSKMVEKATELIEELLQKYKKEQILVLYPRQNYLITKLQEQLMKFGCKMKVYLRAHEMVNELWNVLNYCINKTAYYKVKILQGPFIYLSEPQASYLISSDRFKNCYVYFFDKIVENYGNAEELFNFLLSGRMYCNQVNALVLSEISKLAYGSLAETLNGLPEFIYIETPGIRFSSIHAAKGTESDVVVYIRDALAPVSITIKPNHFIMHDRVYTPMLNSLDYVAKTRARNSLYILDVTFNSNFL